MDNDNVLRGLKCPKCGHTSPLHIEVKVIASVSDDGWCGDDIVYHWGSDWDDDSYCKCPECGYSATVEGFSSEQK